MIAHFLDESTFTVVKGLSENSIKFIQKLFIYLGKNITITFQV